MSDRHDVCDVIVVGGGPAGSSCASALVRAGLHVVVLDKAVFPRDKVCAGWITPQVVSTLGLDLSDYHRGRTLQPILGFRVGVIGASRHVEITYKQPVSYGIRRCEFDQYLLTRSSAAVRQGAPVSSLRRDGQMWVVNELLRAPMLVGAGGHFCPVARHLNPCLDDRAPLVVAREAECAIESIQDAKVAARPDVPELYYASNLQGYGWCFRKEGFVNVGFGSVSRRNLPAAVEAFARHLRSSGRVRSTTGWAWRGHAYLVASPRERRTVGDGVLLVGDAAGLAYVQSGEGIRPAVESGLLAASAILRAQGRYTAARFRPFEQALQARLGFVETPRGATAAAAPWSAALATGFLRAPWFVRHIVLDRWFLRRTERPLAEEHGLELAG